MALSKEGKQVMLAQAVNLDIPNNDHLRGGDLKDSTVDHLFHRPVVSRGQKGIERAEKEGTLTQEEVERQFSKWTSK